MTIRRERFLAFALLALQAGQLTHAARVDGMTFDELLYIASGYRQLVLGDHRFGAEHPPLARLLTATPLVPLDLKVRELSAEDAAAGWSWAHQFVHVDNASQPLLGLARMPTVILSLLLSFVLWRWSRDAFGQVAGLAALGLAAFQPSFLAHGHLATTDLAGTLTLLLASWASWRWYAAPSLGRASAVGIALGAALATRLTGVLLVPVIVAASAVWLWNSRRRRADGAQVMLLGAAMLLIPPLVIWAAYGFRYEPWPGEAMPRIVPSAWLSSIDGSVGSRVLAVMREARILPAAFLASIEVYLIKSVIGHQGFLLGQISATGWPYYYLVAAGLKNTPGFLIATAVMVGLWRRMSTATALHWLLPAVFIFAAASLSRVQVGERYILPVYAYVILLIASLAPALVREKGGMAAAAIIGLLHAGPGLLASSGGYLTYFNLLVSRNDAHLALSDSNLDWGQDLPRLAAWAKDHPDEHLRLAYWGTDDPSRYGFPPEDLLPPGIPATGDPAQFLTGTVAISPTLAAGLYPPPGMAGVYPQLLKLKPDARAGVFLIYRLGP